MKLTKAEINKEFAWPITFLNTEFVRLLENLIQLIQLDTNEIVAFKEKTHLQRQPVLDNHHLPVPIKLKPQNVITLNEIMRHIIHEHIADKNIQSYVIDVESEITKIYYREDRKQEVIASLKEILTTWQEAVYPNLSQWQLVCAPNDVVIKTSGPSYLLDILGFCLCLDSVKFKQLYPILAKRNSTGDFDFSLSLEIPRYPCIDPESDLEVARQLLTSTGIRIECDSDYMVGSINVITSVRDNIDDQNPKTAFEKEFLRYVPLFLNIFKKFTESEKKDVGNICKLIDQLFQRLLEQFPEIKNDPESTHYFGDLHQLSFTYQLASSLNHYANSHQKFDADSHIKVDLTAGMEQETVSFIVDIDLLKNIETTLFNIDELVAKNKLTQKELQALASDLSVLNIFYKDQNITQEAKAHLSYLCYLKLFSPMEKLLTAEKCYFVDQKLSQGRLQVRLAQQQVVAFSLLYLKDELVNDCTFYLQHALDTLILHYTHTQEWERVEYYLARYDIVKRGRKSTEYGTANAAFSQLRAKVYVLVARGALSAAMLKFEELNALFDQQLKSFTKPTNVQQKINDLDHVSFSIFHLADLGQKITDALSLEQQNTIAYSMASSVISSLVKRVEILLNAHGRVIAKIANSPAERIRAMENDIRSKLERAKHNYEQAHLVNLRSACADNHLEELRCGIVKNKKAVVIMVDKENMTFLKKAFSAYNILTTTTNDQVTLKNPLLVTVQKLKLCFRSAQRFKLAHIASVSGQKQLSTEDNSTTSEVVAPVSYSDFIDWHSQKALFQPARKAKNAKRKVSAKSDVVNVTVKSQAKPLVVNFGDKLGIYDEQNPQKSNIVALESAHCPYGIFFGYIDESLPETVRQHFMKALANRGENRGLIVTTKGQEGVKFFKKSVEKAWKIKIPRQDEFLIGHIKTVKADHDSCGLPTKRFLICFDLIGNHKQEYREQKRMNVHKK